MASLKPTTEPIPTPRGEEIGVDDAGRPLHLAREGEPTDKLGRPLQGELATLFGLSLDTQVNLSDALDNLDCLLKLSPDCELVEVRRLTSIAFQTLAKFGPFCVCPACGGMGSRQRKRERLCPVCQGKRYISGDGMPSLNADLREVAEGFK